MPGAPPRHLVVIGLGPAGPELLTAEAQAAISAVPPGCRFLRTRRHPAAPALGPGATSFDDVYDEAASLDEVYDTIVARLLDAAAAASPGRVLYAVPGSPLVAERSVELLRSASHAAGVGVTVLAGVSFADLAWVRLGVDPVAARVSIVDGQRFAVESAGLAGPLLVAQCDSRQVLSEIKLSLSSFDGAPTVTVLQRLGLPDEAVLEVPWEDLDRASAVVPDHLTTIWIPRLSAPYASELVRLVELIGVLRERCPWDREQTHASLAPHLLEEAYETVEAIGELSGGFGERVGAGEHLEEELGDVLLQVVLHATIASEEGWFTLADVATGIHDKMVARHPHVFGGAVAETAAAVQTRWDELKAAERSAAAPSALDDVGAHLPALLHAARLQERAASVGFDWPGVDGPMAKVEEELAELRQAATVEASEHELGDLLFACVNVSRHLGVNPETALRVAAARFASRFRHVERRAGEQLASMSLAELDALWEEAKRKEP